jgi:hypothetical protein
MDSLSSTHLIATALVFAVSLVFSMLGLGGAPCVACRFSSGWNCR